MFDNWGKSAGQADDGGLKPKTWADYDKVVRDGLPGCERRRMEDAYECLRYANGHFDDVEAERSGRGPMTNTQERWEPIRPSNDDARYEKSDFTLAQPVMKRIVGKLSEHLYKRSPTRKLADKGVNAIVEAVYKRNAMGAKWQDADRFSVVGGFAAFQFAGDDDPKCPIKIHLWSADQLCVWTDPLDHTKVDAVCTLEKVDGRTRATLWTKDFVAYYTTKRDETPAGGTRKFTLLSKKPNPYTGPPGTDDEGNETEGGGIIPFSFVHFEQPTTEFTMDSPGCNLKELNRYVNYGFDDLADAIRYILKPIGVAEGVAEDWEAPAIVRPGMFLNLAAGTVDAGGNGPQPQLKFLTADNGFVQVTWSHLNNYLDTSMEMVGVPPSTVRMVLDARSGVSILAEQAPLLGWTQQRRMPFAHYELQAVEMLLRILASHMRTHGVDGWQRLEEAALDPGLSLRWPRLYTDLPGPERDRADGTRLQWGLASLIDILMERDDLTRDQAIEQITRVAEDAQLLTKLGVAPIPPILAAPGQGQGQGGFGQQGDNGWGQQSLPGPSDSTSNAGPSPVTGSPTDPDADADGMSQEGG